MERGRTAGEAGWGASDADLAAVVAWWTANARELPWRRTRDVYAVWVAEVMSAQTTVSRSAQSWSRWMDRWPTVDVLAAASLADVLVEWQGLGYPRRARDLHRSARIVRDEGWPDDLTALPGVGPYVSAAVRCFALEEPVLPVDVNVRRVLVRRFPDRVDISVDPWRCGQALMEFGQRVCSRRPKCDLCPVRRGCGAAESSTAASARRPRRPFEGSLRQRRGQMLARVLAEGAVRIAQPDHAVAAGLAADGLVVLVDDVLRPPLD